MPAPPPSTSPFWRVFRLITRAPTLVLDDATCATYTEREIPVVVLEPADPS